MRPTVLVPLLLVALTSIHGLPLSSNSALWHKITKRDTAAVAPATEKKNNTQTSTNQKDSKPVLTEDKATTGNEDELIETQPEPAVANPDQSSHNAEKASEDEDSSAERSIDWQLLSGNPADLERELESRRRRRSIRSSSLSRQHRIRTAGRVQRSRSKRNAYYDVVNPSDLLAAYEYLQSQRQDQDEEPQLSLLNDVSDSDLSNLASLIYELQRADDGSESPVVDDGDDDDDQDQVLPNGYVDFEQPTEEEPEIRVTPEQLAALEQVLSEQEEDDDGPYPKDKRSVDLDEENADDQDDDEEEEVAEPAYLIPAALEPSTGYVQIPLASYQNPYDFYQIDEDPSIYEEAVRRFDEEQLRDRIASLIEDINEQRQIARRRRRR